MSQPSSGRSAPGTAVADISSPRAMDGAMTVEEEEFPASHDSPRTVRRWAEWVLVREKVPDALVAQAVLVVSELASQVIQHLRPEATAFTAQVRVSDTTIVLTATCAVGDIVRSPHRLDGEQRRLHRTLVDAFSDHHGWCGNDIYRARYAEIDWHPPRPRATVLPVVSGAPPRPPDWPGAPPR